MLSPKKTKIVIHPAEEPLDPVLLAREGKFNVVLNIVRNLNAEGKYHEALFTAECLEPNLPTTLLEQAYAFVSIGHFDHIEDHLKRIFTEIPSNLFFLYQASKQVAYAEMMRGDFEKAQSYANRAIEYAYLSHQSDQKIEAMILLARIHAYAGDFEACNTILNQVLEQNPAVQFSPQASHYNYAISHYLYMKADPQCSRFNAFARISSEGSKLPVFEYKCQVESFMMQQVAGLNYDSEYEGHCREFASTSGSDLKNWVSAILDKGPCYNAVLKTLLK